MSYRSGVDGHAAYYSRNCRTCPCPSQISPLSVSSVTNREYQKAFHIMNDWDSVNCKAWMVKLGFCAFMTDASHSRFATLFKLTSSLNTVATYSCIFSQLFLLPIEFTNLDQCFWSRSICTDSISDLAISPTFLPTTLAGVLLRSVVSVRLSVP